MESAPPLVLVSRPLRVPKTAEIVAGELRRRIIRGQLKESDVLPPEANLLVQFGVSRPTLREALRILEAEALIVIRRGARGGCLVRPPSVEVAARQLGLLLQFSGATLGDVYRARQGFEPFAAGMLAQRFTKAMAASLDEIVEDERLALERKDREAFAKTSLRFHERVVELSGNRTLALFTKMLHDLVELHMAGIARGEVAARVPPEMGRAESASHRAHQRLLEHLEAGDDRASEALWRSHLEGVGHMILPDADSKVLVDLLS